MLRKIGQASPECLSYARGMLPKTLREHRTRIVDAIDYIQANLGGDLCLDTLAARAGLSPHYFHRVFSAVTREPPRAYVRRLRLERAARRLRHRDPSIAVLAFEAGYETHEAFTRAFKSRFGVPPCRFRSFAARDEGRVELDARIVRVPARKIAFVRHVGPYDAASVAFERLRDWADRRGLSNATALTVYWDDQRITAPEHTRCDAALVIEAEVAASGDVRVRELPGGDCAVVRHEHPYRVPVVRRTYDALYRDWLPAKGRTAADRPPFEMYTRGQDTTDAGGTVLHVPVASGRAA